MSNVPATANDSGEFFADYARVQDYLSGMKARGVRLGMERMKAWVAALGNPGIAAPVIHVAGTNGKGSVAAMLEAVFREAGWRTGLYTSPHLVMLGERVQVNREPLAPAEILALANRMRPVAEAIARENPDAHPSFFEFMTAMAFMQFARKKCDINIIEAGMGGRNDATNVVAPELSVITSVSLDHCEMLGDTIEKIAREKAGVIKRGKPVVIGHLPAAAEAVVRRVAGELDCRVYSISEEFGEDYPQTNLEGGYQRWNAATATLAARVLMRGQNAHWRLSEEVIARGLRRVDWPGRWQRITIGGRALILDASHNIEGAQALDENLARLRAAFGGGEASKPLIVTGTLGATRARALLEVACRHAGGLYLVVPNQARACSHEELESLVPRGFTGKIHRSTIEKLFPEPARCALPDARVPVVVTGSIYLLGEIFARLSEGVKPEGHLQDF